MILVTIYGSTSEGSRRKERILDYASQTPCRRPGGIRLLWVESELECPDKTSDCVIIVAGDNEVSDYDITEAANYLVQNTDVRLVLAGSGKTIDRTKGNEFPKVHAPSPYDDLE